MWDNHDVAPSRTDRGHPPCRSLCEVSAVGGYDRSALVLPTRRGSIVIAGREWGRLSERICLLLDVHHAQFPHLPGVGIEQLRREQKPPPPASAFLAILEHLERYDALVVDRIWVRRPSHYATFAAEDEAIWCRIHPHLQREAFCPPRVRQLATELSLTEERVRSVLQLAVRRGNVEEVAHDRFYLREAVGDLARAAIEVSAASPRGIFEARAFRDHIGIGRKLAIQILEFFDCHGFTTRHRDWRRINAMRASLFGSPARASKRDFAQ